MNASKLLLNAYVHDGITLNGDEQHLRLANRMRLFAPPNVIDEAEVVIRALIEISLKPSLDLRKLAIAELSKDPHSDLLLSFSQACRTDWRSETNRDRTFSVLGKTCRLPRRAFLRPAPNVWFRGLRQSGSKLQLLVSFCLEGAVPGHGKAFSFLAIGAASRSGFPEWRRERRWLCGERFRRRIERRRRDGRPIRTGSSSSLFERRRRAAALARSRCWWTGWRGWRGR